MASLGQLVVNLEANIARFTSDMGRASQVTEQTMNKIDGAVEFGKKALGALGVALSVDLIVSEINRSLDSLAALDDMAQKTGSSVETLSKLSKVAAFTGTDLGAVDGMLVKLSKNLNDVDEKGNKTAKALAAIGISTDDIKGKDPAEVFVMIANKMQDYEDGAGKVANVTDLMGKSAADMLPYMNDVAESLDKFQGDSAEAAAQAAALQDGLGELKLKYEELKTGIVLEALPAANAFIGALQDTLRESKNLVDDTSMTTWADDVALIFARMADGGALVGRTFKAVNAELTATAANIEYYDAISRNVNPIGAAKVLLSGGSPTDNIKAALDKRNATIAAANETISSLWTKPLDGMEQAMYSRIAGRFDKGLADGADALAGMVPAQAVPRTTLKYSSGDDKDKDKEKKKKADKEWTRDAAAGRSVEFALDETLAIKNTADATEHLIETDKRRAEQYARTSAQITADAENIRMSLMTDAQAEQFEHETRLSELQAFGALKLENEMTANALIEAETARHAQAQRDMQMFAAQDILGIAQSSADQLYSALKAAGMEQTALGKAMFIAQKAIQVASIIVNTEVAAAAAQAGMIAAAGATAAVSGPAGPGILAAGIAAGAAYATMTRVMGYATAGLVAGTAIASAEGGYDIPAGVNPVTQLHEKEMVLPKAQAEVIRNLAVNGGGAGMKVTIVNQTTGRIDNVIEKQISPTERALIIQEAVAATASTLGDPNSKMSRSMARNLNVARTRS